jgi:hypothetical protein
MECVLYSARSVIEGAELFADGFSLKITGRIENHFSFACVQSKRLCISAKPMLIIRQLLRSPPGPHAPFLTPMKRKAVFCILSHCTFKYNML